MLLTAVESRSVRWRCGTLPSARSAFCNPSLRLSKLSEKHTIGLPVRVRKNEVIDQVRKTLPLDGHAQLFHVREVRRSKPTRRMLLCKEHLPSRTLGCTPYLHPPLQRAHLPVLKATGVLPLQKLEHRLGLKPGVVFKQLLHIVPDLNERVWPGSSTHCHWHLAWQSASATILPRRLRVHSSLGRRNLLVFLCVYQRKQPPNLPVCDQSASASTHRNPLGLIVNVREFCSSPVEPYDCRPSDARGFWDLVRENRDDLKWCGSSPIYTFMRAVPQARGTLRRYEQWNIDEQSVVTFAGIS